MTVDPQRVRPRSDLCRARLLLLTTNYLLLLTMCYYILLRFYYILLLFTILHIFPISFIVFTRFHMFSFFL